MQVPGWISVAVQTGATRTGENVEDDCVWCGTQIFSGLEQGTRHRSVSWVAPTPQHFAVNGNVHDQVGAKCSGKENKGDLASGFLEFDSVIAAGPKAAPDC